MRFCRRRLRSLTWLAWFAMFGLALAPTLSHALAGSGAAGGINPWAEICSAAAGQPGALAVAPHAATTPLSKVHATQLDHCPLCAHGSAATALPAAGAASFEAPDGAHFVPALFAHAPRPLFAWAASQPRGPPAIP